MPKRRGRGWKMAQAKTHGVEALRALEVAEARDRATRPEPSQSADDDDDNEGVDD